MTHPTVQEIQLNGQYNKYASYSLGLDLVSNHGVKTWKNS